MSTVEVVNPMDIVDAPGWVRQFLATLLVPAYDDDFQRRLAYWDRDWDAERVWGCRDRGRWVATLATEPKTLTVPDGGMGTADVEVDALTAVTVAATHRRQGLLNAMLTQSLDAAKERGDALSILIAAEWPIYGRYGYGTAVDTANYTYYPRRPNAALPPSSAGSVRGVEVDELAGISRGIFDRARRLRAGQIDRRDPWWDRRLAQDGYEAIGPLPNWVVHEGADGPDGMLAWKATRDFEIDGRLGAIEVANFCAANDTAYRDLWGYLSGIDVIDEIQLSDRPVDEPIRWLLRDGRALHHTGRNDMLWVRLLDVPAALSARGYQVPGSIVLDVLDTDRGGFAAGRFRLDAGPDGVQCTPTSDAADLRLSQRVLASSYLGGHRLRSVAFAGGVEELTDGALALADIMFSTPTAPFCQTFF